MTAHCRCNPFCCSVHVDALRTRDWLASRDRSSTPTSPAQTTELRLASGQDASGQSASGQSVLGRVLLGRVLLGRVLLGRAHPPGESTVAQHYRFPLLSPVLDLTQAPVKIQCLGSLPESQANSMMQSLQ